MISIDRLVAAAGKINPKDIGYQGYTTNANAGLTGILNLVYAAAGIAAVIVLVIAGAIYITSNDDQGKIARAKNAIMGAVAGLVIIMMAFTITQFVLGSF